MAVAMRLREWGEMMDQRERLVSLLCLRMSQLVGGAAVTVNPDGVTIRGDGRHIDCKGGVGFSL